MYQYTEFGAASAALRTECADRLATRPVEWSGADNTGKSTSLVNRASRIGSPSTGPTAQATGVLIVDDDPNILSLVSAILNFEGYIVWSATNGREALKFLDHARPALAMVDLYMPDLDGWCFVRALEDRRLQLPVLLMAAAKDGQHWAREIGAVGCVTKPFDVQDLLDEVERLLAPLG
jgi:CheY-like chemotaxis protein